jgi:hypothetical protein
VSGERGDGESRNWSLKNRETRKKFSKWKKTTENSGDGNLRQSLTQEVLAFNLGKLFGREILLVAVT